MPYADENEVVLANRCPHCQKVHSAAELARYGGMCLECKMRGHTKRNCLKCLDKRKN